MNIGAGGEVKQKWYFISFHNSPACAVARRGSWVVSLIGSFHEGLLGLGVQNPLSVLPPPLWSQWFFSEGFLGLESKIPYLFWGSPLVLVGFL